jgi:hypothetical protein
MDALVGHPGAAIVEQDLSPNSFRNLDDSVERAAQAPARRGGVPTVGSPVPIVTARSACGRRTALQNAR